MEGRVVHAHTHREETEPEKLVTADHSCFPQPRLPAIRFYYNRNKNNISKVESHK